MRRLGCILLACGFLLTMDAAPAGADLSDKEAKRRMLRVKKRTRDYLAALRGLVIRCATCNGTGVQTWYAGGVGGGRMSRTCPTCEGRKQRISPKRYALLHYDLMSPAYRRQQGRRASLEVQRLQEERTQFPRPVARTYCKDAELADDTHAIAWIRLGADTTKRPLRWVWAVEQGKKRGDWFLYQPKVDGPWPGTKAHTLENPGEALAGAELDDVKAALAMLTPKLRVVGRRKIGRTLILQLEARGAVLPATAIRDDALAIVRSIWPGRPHWTGVRLHFDVPFKNKFGRIELKPYGHVHMPLRTFQEIVWPNLTPDEAFALFESRWQHHPGWVPQIR